MIVGLPKEIKDNEYRVGLTPAGVRALKDANHEIHVEASAGEVGERLRRASGDVDAARGHHPYRVRVERLGMAASAAGVPLWKMPPSCTI